MCLQAFRMCRPSLPPRTRPYAALGHCCALGTFGATWTAAEESDFYRRCDQNGSGVISRGELRHALHSMQMGWPDDEISALIGLGRVVALHHRSSSSYQNH